MIVATTGHRPDKVGDYSDEARRKRIMIRREFVKSMMAAACGLCLPSVNQIITKLDEPRLEFRPGFYEVPLHTVLADWSKSFRVVHSSDGMMIDSILKCGGIMSRLTCAPIKDDPHHVQLVCGYRRYHALSTIGPTHQCYHKVPIVVGDFGDVDNIVESTTSRELTHEEEVGLIRRLLEFGQSESDVAKRMRMSQHYIRKVSTGKVWS